MIIYISGDMMKSRVRYIVLGLAIALLAITTVSMTLSILALAETPRTIKFGTFPIPTPPAPTPLPEGTCPPESVKKPDCECPPYQKSWLVCEDFDDEFDEAECTSHGGIFWPCCWPCLPFSLSCHSCLLRPGVDGFGGGLNCQEMCLGKPVIYLYPTKPTLVDVTLQIPGRIVESDPLYPSGGWKEVLAYPDGTLLYQGEKYRELYYESKVGRINPPKTGLVISVTQLKEKLTEITTKLGLTPFEQEEFLEYWLPKLTRLKTPYLLFSLLDGQEKKRVDTVNISPQPDTRIEFIAYFKPLSAPIEIQPLALPDQPPKRIGFTVVEWGGTIDY